MVPIARPGMVLFILGALLFLSPAPGTAQKDYVIGPEDVLEVTVFGEEELSRKVTVSIEGSITLPLIGKVQAAGLAASQLSLRIAELYSGRYLVKPQVSVFIKEYKSKRVLVLGAVKQPGLHTLTRETSLLEVLGMAGGLADDAGLELMLLRPSEKRSGGGPITLGEARQEEIKIIPVKPLLEGNLANNLPVKANDTIYVGYKTDKTVYVLGQVRSPGKYPLGTNSTIIEMISRAGGVTEEAGLDALVVRPSENKKGRNPIMPQEAEKDELINIDLKALLDGDLTNNMALKDGDTVFVTHRMDKKVYIMGEVQRSGKYPMERNSTVLDVLSKAGGVTNQAGLELVLVRPTAPGRVKGPIIPDQARQDEIMVIDLKTLLGGDLRANMLVKDEDTIFVPHELSKKVHILGAVKSPGTFPLGRRPSLIEVISRAGGLADEAADEVLIIKPTDRRKEGPLLPEEAKAGEVTSVDMRTIRGGDLSKDILLRDGDTIFVPKAEVFFVLGQVNKPGRYRLERGMTLLQAISVAGGLTAKASSSRIKVLREVNSVKKEFGIGLNSPVLPQDTIIIPERFF